MLGSMGLGRSVVGAAGGAGGLFIPALRRGNRVVLTWSLVGESGVLAVVGRKMARPHRS